MSPSGLTLDETLERIERELESFRASLPPVPPDLPRDVSLLVVHIHECLFDPKLSIASARDACKLRNNNVSGRFRRNLGSAPKQYIERLRMEAAGRLLRLDDVPVYLVAGAVGYEHTEVFARAFSRSTGMTPTAFRGRGAARGTRNPPPPPPGGGGGEYPGLGRLRGGRPRFGEFPSRCQRCMPQSRTRRGEVARGNVKGKHHTRHGVSPLESRCWFSKKRRWDYPTAL
jgi:AraC-like DNA-binding protein